MTIGLSKIFFFKLFETIGVGLCFVLFQVEGMGGTTSDYYQQFRKLCFTAFLHLRRLVVFWLWEILFQLRKY